MQSTVQSVVIVLLSVLLALLGQTAVRRLVRHETLAAHTAVAGFVYATLGVVYGVILAQVVVAAWDDYEDARLAVEAEASALLDLVRLAEGWPEPERQAVERALLAYGQTVVAEEWAAMERGEPRHPSAVNRMVAVWRAYEGIEPGALGATARYEVSLGELNELDDARGLRLLASRRSLPGQMWAVLIFGGVLMVAFAYLFGVENRIAQAVMLSALTSLIVLLLLLVHALDTPFRGSTRIRSDAFDRVLRLAEAETDPSPTPTAIGGLGSGAGAAAFAAPGYQVGGSGA